MGLFNRKGNADKIQLQNIVLGINEKKLEVSEEFLQNMTKVYVSKRMKLINDTISGFEQLCRVSVYFKKIAYVNRLLDELIAIEPYYIFKYPGPSEYKRQLEENEDNYISQILNRSWKYIRYDSSSQTINPEVSAYFSDAKSVWEKLPETSRNMLEELHNTVYGFGLFEDPDAKSEEEQSAEDETDELSNEMI
ncbi:MAG: hypothetical protein ACI4XF_02700 [Oscillospiraceae bacterium]